ncbi:HD family phosphohydrolase [Zoogloea oryzae]|uniref:HD family phosphohydrolase n=1 Tax=Zoogloea oryzae TaxID=310767 RepID=A0ABQ6FBA1_9RHOO|nr:HDOD domain-containing protein [Zoogloea oryzae]GLT22487.1 HD family phosphohydrolase [Zoogloea oryzae]
MSQPSLADIVSHIHSLPAMPAVALELLQTLSGGDPDVDALASRIARDQAITARVLRVANSPFYGLQMRVGSIHDAIVVLGFSAVRSLVLTSAVVTTLPAGKCAGFSADRFWRHVLGTAVAAQALARPLRRKPESLFIAGLLHDIGRLVMLSANPEGFARVIQIAAERDCHLVDVETEIFGCDHTAVGAAIAQHWNFPADIVEALAFHHNPAQTAPGSLAAIIHYADGIAKALDLEGAENTQMARLQPAAIDALGLDWQTLTAVLAETHGRFEAHLPLLG